MAKGIPKISEALLNLYHFIRHQSRLVDRELVDDEAASTFDVVEDAAAAVVVEDVTIGVGSAEVEVADAIVDVEDVSIASDFFFFFLFLPLAAAAFAEHLRVALLKMQWVVLVWVR